MERLTAELALYYIFGPRDFNNHSLARRYLNLYVKRTFNLYEDDNLYDCCNLSVITTKTSLNISLYHGANSSLSRVNVQHDFYSTNFEWRDTLLTNYFVRRHTNSFTGERNPFSVYI